MSAVGHDEGEQVVLVVSPHCDGDRQGEIREGKPEVCGGDQGPHSMPCHFLPA